MSWRSQDDVLPEPFSDVRPTLEKELGPLEDIFEYFDPSAISGASLGQVYRAKHKEKDVVVKISRPNIEETIGQNIYILRKLLPFATVSLTKISGFQQKECFLNSLKQHMKKWITQ